MSDLDWRTLPANTWVAPADQRDMWAKGLIADPATWLVESGDSLVIAWRDPHSGITRLYDCLIRRTARIVAAPSEHGREETSK